MHALSPISYRESWCDFFKSKTESKKLVKHKVSLVISCREHCIICLGRMCIQRGGEWQEFEIRGMELWQRWSKCRDRGGGTGRWVDRV